jgi:ElaB/YqjD/DUF883 family membrane-anchored ribosome-binding protein
MLLAVGDYMQEFQGSARSSAADASRFMREQPLVVGAAGIALGALIGAMLPPTRFEDELVGKKSDSMTDEVEQVAGEKLRQGASAAREKVESTAEETRKTVNQKRDEVDEEDNSVTDKPVASVCSYG